MKNIILSLILLLANSTYAQGPEAREEGFSIDALLQHPFCHPIKKIRKKLLAALILV